MARTHSRPRVSDDNPYIEAHFKTLKYCPAWPGHFDTLADAYAANPARFAARPLPPKHPTVARINEPQEALIQNRSRELVSTALTASAVAPQFTRSGCQQCRLTYLLS